MRKFREFYVKTFTKYFFNLATIISKITFKEFELVVDSQTFSDHRPLILCTQKSR